MPGRFIDDGRTVEAFAGLFLVECPRCSRRASVVTPAGAAVRASLVPKRRLACGRCGFAADWPDERADVFKWTLHSGPFDWCFDRPLWLQRPCCGRVLFAYNAGHLAYLRRFVSAELREVARHRNRILASRLPRWMQLRRHRREVLAGIERLEARLLET